MRRLVVLTSACAWLIYGAAEAAEAFKPDRSAFFSRCAKIMDYEKRDGALVAVGRRALNAKHIETINYLIDHWETVGNSDKRQLAYIIATAYRETHGRLEPIREAPRCGTDELCRERAIGAVLEKYARRRGGPPNPNYALPAANGQRYYGRGYSQLTLAENYKKADGLLGTGTLLFDNPDEALKPEYSRRFLIEGLMKRGFYTKRILSDYFSATTEDWVGARNILNPGSPNKEVTAAYGKDFNKCFVPRQ